MLQNIKVFWRGMLTQMSEILQYSEYPEMLYISCLQRFWVFPIKVPTFFSSMHDEYTTPVAGMIWTH